MSKYFKIASVLTLIFIAAYVALLFIQPSSIVQKIFLFKFNNPGKVDAATYRDIRNLIYVSALAAIFIRLLESKYKKPLVDFIVNALEKFSAVFNIKVLLGISFIYLAILFYFAITHYDMGFDEAWVIYYAKNFSSRLIAFTDTNGKIGFIDTLSMLPYLILSLVNFKAGLTSVADFKFLSVLLSVISLFISFVVTKKFYGRKVAAVSLFVLIIQPGFGFMASSFFGEITAAAFLFGGLHIWLKEPAPPDTKKILLSSILFALAIHTKFQVAPILAVILVILHFTDSNNKPLKILAFTIATSASIMLIRIVPILAYDPKLTGILLKLGYLDNAFSASALFLFEKIQLYNRFFPLSVLLVSLGVFFFYLKTIIDRFLFLFASLISLWWIFLYPYTTYRNPFMGIIPLSIIISILVVKLYDAAETKKRVFAGYAAGLLALSVMAYGFSTNIIYAYIGYNDGVQFDLDGYRSSLFTPVVEDDSQKRFYSDLGKIVSPADTLYNGTYVTKFYLDNAIADLPNLTESIRTNPERKLLLITRERYPLDMEKGRQILDSVHATWKLGLKRGDYEMYEIVK